MSCSGGLHVCAGNTSKHSRVIYWYVYSLRFVSLLLSLFPALLDPASNNRFLLFNVMICLFTSVMWYPRIASASSNGMFLPLCLVCLPRSSFSVHLKPVSNSCFLPFASMMYLRRDPKWRILASRPCYEIVCSFTSFHLLTGHSVLCCFSKYVSSVSFFTEVSKLWCTNVEKLLPPHLLGYYDVRQIFHCMW